MDTLTHLGTHKGYGQDNGKYSTETRQDCKEQEPGQQTIQPFRTIFLLFQKHRKEIGNSCQDTNGYRDAVDPVLLVGC